MEQIIKKCWTIFNEDTGQWTSKNRLDAMKLLKDTVGTKFEILNQGPVSLRAQQMEQKIKQLVEEEEVPRKSFFTLGFPTSSYEDLR